MRALFRKLGWLLGRRSKEDQLAAELKFHLEAEAEERREAGLCEAEARWAAQRDMGNLGLVKEQTRAAWGWRLWEQSMQDLRYAARTMWRSPAFTLLAVLSLALGIGANTAIYSFMDALMFRQLPVTEPQQLVVLNWHDKGRSQGSVVHGMSGSIYEDRKYVEAARIFPYPAFELFQKSDQVFSSLFAYYPTRAVNVMIRGETQIAHGQYVSGEYFRGLGLSSPAGRLLTPEDDRPGAPPLAVLGYEYSQRRFGDAATAVGQSILINNVPCTVAGVTPPGFLGIDPAVSSEIYFPMHANPQLQPDRWGRRLASRYLNRNDYWIEMAGRLRPGVSATQAQAALAPVFHTWVASTATTDAERANLPEFHLTDGAAGLDTLRRRYSEPFFLLLTMVGLILAIACANIGNLLLARATARKREMAVRLGMGAGRWRVIRQLLLESWLLASMGGAAGVVFAIWGVKFLTLLFAKGPDNFMLHAELNWRVLGVAAGLSMLTGLVFGLAPALRATRVEVMPALKGGRAGNEGRIRFAWSRVLVVTQIAITLLLLMGAGLFVRTLLNLRSIELGFNRENVLLFKLNARQAGHRDPEIISFYSGLVERLGSIPGVRGATVSNSPLVGEGTHAGPTYPVGKPLGPEADKAENRHGGHSNFILTAAPRYFATMEIPLLAGREFDARDRLGSPPVAIVNEAWAEANFGRENPIGRRIVVEVEREEKAIPEEFEVVGVAKDSRYGRLTGEFPGTVYLAFAQNLYYPADETTFTLRTGGDPLAVVRDVLAVVNQADVRIPVTAIKTQAAMVEQIIYAEVIFAQLCTAFAILALLIAGVGLYGTMSYMVAQRTGEIGIRMALGARRGQVMWLVMTQVLLMAILGLAIGAPIAYGSSRLVASFLYGITGNDPIALGIAIGTLIAAAALAGYAPARRACRVDPMVALRHE